MYEECTKKGKPFYVAEDTKSVYLGYNKAMTQSAHYRGTPAEAENNEEWFVKSDSANHFSLFSTSTGVPK